MKKSPEEVAEDRRRDERRDSFRRAALAGLCANSFIFTLKMPPDEAANSHRLLARRAAQFGDAAAEEP